MMIVTRAFVRLTVNLEKRDYADLQKRWTDVYQLLQYCRDTVKYKYKEHKANKLVNIIYVKQRC